MRDSWRQRIRVLSLPHAHPEKRVRSQSKPVPMRSRPGRLFPFASSEVPHVLNVKVGVLAVETEGCLKPGHCHVLEQPVRPFTSLIAVSPVFGASPPSGSAGVGAARSGGTLRMRGNDWSA
jgi:hypothetical protein